MTDDRWDRKPADEHSQDRSAFPPLPPESTSLSAADSAPTPNPPSVSAPSVSAPPASLPPAPAPAAASRFGSPELPDPSTPTASVLSAASLPAAPTPAATGIPAASNPVATQAEITKTMPQPSVPDPGSSPAGARFGSAEPPRTPPQSVGPGGWSALGATPAAPPVRPAPSPGATRYLPPVAPPTTASGPPVLGSGGQIAAGENGAGAKTPARWGWRALLSFVAGGLVAAAGFGAAQLSTVNDSETVAAEAVTTTASTAPLRDSGAFPPGEVEEPAAFVAEVLGPSVVQIETGLGVGSGVIFGDGLILTNNHVVEGAFDLDVKLADGSVLPATVLGTDVNTDVAVVSVGPGLDLPIALLATGEKAQVGQVAIAIGSPFDLQQSVTAGIVSAVDRPIRNTERGVVAMIQTDAPINPGNSGGALADRFGRVIGINTSIQTDGLTTANVGVGFAVPIDTAIRVANLLVAGEPILPGFLGVSGAEPSSGEAGVELTEITAGSAAEAAGLQVGDRVLSLNDAPVTGFAELAGMVVANQAGDTVSLEVVRAGQLVELDVTLGERATED